MLEAGGNPTGRSSKFKFPAGTKEGDDERREAERDRKAAARAIAAKMVEPPPLPSAGAGLADPTAATFGGESPGAVVEAARPVVPWTPEMLQELTDGIVDALEERRVEKFSGKARQAELPDKLVREIANDARYPVIGKRGLKTALPQVGAKIANKAGVSAEHLPEVILAKAITLNFFHGRRLESRLDKLIEVAREEKKAEQEQKGKLP